MVQEYGRYFGMKTAAFRGGTLTGPAHSAAELHGFLGYLMRCVMEGRTYNLFGYKGKRCATPSTRHDVLTAFEAFFRAPRSARDLQHRRRPVLQRLAHRGVRARRGDQRLETRRSTTWSRPRVGDHQWWISSMARFQEHYPDWKQTYDVPMILREIYEANVDKWVPSS